MIQNINEIKHEELYKPNEIAILLDVHESTITRKCQSWVLKATNVGTEKRSTWRIFWIDLLNYLSFDKLDISKLEKWDKIVYDWYNKKEYILVKDIDDLKIRGWSTIRMINNKYCISGPLRKPSPLELEVAKFI